MQHKKKQPRQKRVANPSSKTRRPKQSSKLKGTVVVCYETRRCNLSESQLKKMKSGGVCRGMGAATKGGNFEVV